MLVACKIVAKCAVERPWSTTLRQARSISAHDNYQPGGRWRITSAHFTARPGLLRASAGHCPCCPSALPTALRTPPSKRTERAGRASSAIFVIPCPATTHGTPVESNSSYLYCRAAQYRRAPALSLLCPSLLTPFALPPAHTSKAIAGSSQPLRSALDCSTAPRLHYACTTDHARASSVADPLPPPFAMHPAAS
jgi:hypothetical protein